MKPTTEQIAAAYISQRQRHFHAKTRGVMTPEERRAIEDNFYQWLAEVKSEAWEEGYDTPTECCGLCPSDVCPWNNNPGGPKNPYRKETNDG